MASGASGVRQHLTLSGIQRTIIVGDVHGCLHELQELLSTVRYKPVSDRLIYVGDLVNKGPLSLETLQFVQNQKAKNPSLVHAVVGNHDESALRTWQGWNKDKNLSLPSYYQYVKSFTRENIAFLASMPLSVSLSDFKVRVVHAGVVPGISLKSQSFKDLTTIRNVVVDDDGHHWKGLSSTENGMAWGTEWRDPEWHIVFGHDAKRRLQQHVNATGIDTGACYGHELTALTIPGFKLQSVKAPAVYTIPGSKV